MARFCTNCGKEIEDGISFCTECGTKASPGKTVSAVSEPEKKEAPSPAPPPPPAPPQPTYARPVYAQPAPVYAPVSSVDESERVVGMGTFFGLNFLFGVPLIGWIACVLMSFTSKNKNIKNYARAMLIWILIGAVLSVAFFFAIRGLVGVVKDYVNDFIGEYTGQNGEHNQTGQSGSNAGTTDEEGIGGLLGSLGQLGELTDILGQLGDLEELGGLTESDLGALGNLPVE